MREDDVDETAVQRLLPMRLNRRGPGIAIGDLNADGIDDVVIGGTTQTRARVLAGSAKGAFTDIDTSAVLPAGAVDDGPVLLFDAQGKLTNDSTREFLRKFLNAFVTWIDRNAGQ